MDHMCKGFYSDEVSVIWFSCGTDTSECIIVATIFTMAHMRMSCTDMHTNQYEGVPPYFSRDSVTQPQSPNPNNHISH